MKFALGLSGRATSNAHGEDSPYVDGWKECDRNPYHPQNNPSVTIQMGLAENQGIASLMEEVVGTKMKFESDRIVVSAGATPAQEVLAFCLADPGEAFLVPTPYYLGSRADPTRVWELQQFPGESDCPRKGLSPCSVSKHNSEWPFS